MRTTRLSPSLEVACFFLLSLLAWAVSVPQALHRLGALDWTVPLRSPLNLLIVWAPGLAAIALSLHIGRGKGVAGLFAPIATWRVPLVWYAFAALYHPAAWLAALGIDRLGGRSYELGGVPLFEALGTSAASLAPAALVLTLPNALGEELGWRGFALGRLQRLGGPLAASVILGLFWGLWHVPMWIAQRAAAPAWLPIGLMAVNLVPTTVLFTLLFNHTRGSLLLACLFHASATLKGYLLPRLPTLTETVLLWLVAAVAVAAGGLSGPPESAGGEADGGRSAGREERAGDQADRGQGSAPPRGPQPE